MGVPVGGLMEPIQIVITFTPDNGNINVSAPTDKIIAYGLLEIAREVIAARPKEEPSKLIRPVVVPNVAVRG